MNFTIRLNFSVFIISVRNIQPWEKYLKYLKKYPTEKYKSYKFVHTGILQFTRICSSIYISVEIRYTKNDDVMHIISFLHVHVHVGLHVGLLNLSNMSGV